MLPMEEITVRVRAVAAGIGDSEKGSRYVFVTGSVVDHEQYNGSTITATLYFTPKTQERSIESLMHFGFTSDDLELLADANAAKCAELLPEVVEYVCAPEEYNGEWSLKVKWVNKPGRGKFTPKKKLEGADLKAFAAQMKGALRNARGGAPKKNGSAPAPAATGKPEDDLPFASADMDHEPSPIARVLR